VLHRPPRQRLGLSTKTSKPLLVFIKFARAVCEMYTGLAFLVLFDARGSELDTMTYAMLVVCAVFLLLCLSYLPHILHRPALVDAFCADVLSISVSVHWACISVLSDPLLRHACALHSACFCVETRFMGTKKNNAIQPILHTGLVFVLLSAYAFGPRITEIKQFMLGAVCPHVLQLIARALIHLHSGLVSFLIEKST
jgi:hypothetical protein